MGAYDKSRFLFLQDYIEDGCKTELSPDDQDYLNVLHILNSMSRKFGKDKAIKFVTMPPFEIAPARARSMFDEAINLFFSTDNIERQAHRNKMFDDVEKAAQLALSTAKNHKDLEVYGKLKELAYKVKGLHLPDPVKVPEGLYQRNIKIYSLNPETIGIDPIDRNELAALIDGIDEISTKDKKRLKRDASIETINFIEMYGDQEEEVKLD
jgi:hypothetical protein